MIIHTKDWTTFKLILIKDSNIANQYTIIIIMHIINILGNYLLSINRIVLSWNWIQATLYNFSFYKPYVCRHTDAKLFWNLLNHFIINYPRGHRLRAKIFLTPTKRFLIFLFDPAGEENNYMCILIGYLLTLKPYVKVIYILETEFHIMPNVL